MLYTCCQQVYGSSTILHLLYNTLRCIGRHIFPKLQALRRKEDDCEIEENVAYATAHGDRVWSQNFFLQKKEEEEDGQDYRGYEGEGEEIPELDYAPDLPSREYLKQKEVVYLSVACMHGIICNII